MLSLTLKDIISSRYALIIIIIVAYIYNIIVHQSKIITTLMIFVLVYFFYLYDVSSKLSNNEFLSPAELKLDYMDKITKKEIGIHKDENFFVDNTGLYQIYRKPEKFIFLPRDKYLEQVLYDLRFIRRYDHGDFSKLTILMEEFLKIYYNLIIDRYESRYFDHAMDIRLEIINTMYNFHVDAPLRETKHGRNLSQIISDSIEDVQTYTMKKIKNLGNKFPGQKYKIKNPRAISSDRHELTDNYQIVL
jgi:hypothetical protein